MENIEIWKEVSGYEGKYEASTLGRIKSMSRKIKRKRGFFISKELILKLSINSSGYEYLNLCLEGKVMKYKVHQLVAMAFLNHVPNKMALVVNHKNSVRNDNRLDNLEIVTQRENSCNKNIKTTSNYTGVSWQKNIGKWQSGIRIKGKPKHLGFFLNEIEAHQAYQSALLSLN